MIWLYLLKFLPILCKGSIQFCLTSIPSRLQVNYHKSEIFFCNVSPADQDALTSMLGMKKGQFPVRYLGVPLISGKLKGGDCQALIDKITSRIKSWTAKYQTFAGRLLLIDSVLNTMVNFWLSVFQLPKKVIKAVERICTSYLLNGVSDSAKRAKVAWSKVCLPKTEGDLGLKDLYTWNKSHLARQLGLLLCESGFLGLQW